jgi:hypothetical protein
MPWRTGAQTRLATTSQRLKFAVTGAVEAGRGPPVCSCEDHRPAACKDSYVILITEGFRPQSGSLLVSFVAS